MTELVQCSFTVTPTKPYEIPYSDGHILYSAVLNQTQKIDPDASELLHSANNHVHTTPLKGRFDKTRKRGQKKLKDEEYSFSISTVKTSEGEIDSVLNALAFELGEVQLGDGTLKVASAQTKSIQMEELVQQAVNATDTDIQMQFTSPTCIKSGENGSTEMFPHRGAVFGSVIRRWNKFAPERLTIDLCYEEIKKGTYELPDYDSMRSHNVVVKTVGEHSKPIKRHGFTGNCTYRIHPEVSDSVTNAILTGGLAAEYLGVGSAVARGCGEVEVRLSTHH